MSRKNKRKRKHHRQALQGVVAGVAWYAPDEWAKVKALAADPDALEPTYELWLKMAESSLKELAAAGLQLHKVMIEAEELAAWCESKDLAIDGAARAEYATVKIRGLDVSGS